MSALDIATGKIVAHMSASSARRLTDEIRVTLTSAKDQLIEAWTGRADLALGYESWDAYCAAEFTEARMLRPTMEQRREIVAAMRAEGMSTRAIGSALGADQSTVVRDLQSSDANASDDTVTSLDGRQRPATQPPRAQGLPPDSTPTDDGDASADPRPVDGEPADPAVEDPTPAPSVPRPSPEAVARHERERDAQVSREAKSQNLAKCVWMLAQFAEVDNAIDNTITEWQPDQDIYPKPTTADRIKSAADYLFALSERWPQ